MAPIAFKLRDLVVFLELKHANHAFVSVLLGLGEGAELFAHHPRDVELSRLLNVTFPWFFVVHITGANLHKAFFDFPDQFFELMHR